MAADFAVPTALIAVVLVVVVLVPYVLFWRWVIGVVMRVHERRAEIARREVLRRHAAEGDLRAMQELAAVNDPEYMDALRGAFRDVLGEEL